MDRGGRAEDVDALIRHADEAAVQGLPPAPLTNKIREGLAKGHDPKRIEPVVRQIRAQLETADQLMREIDPAATGAARDASVSLLAESLGGGVTANDVRELRKQAQATGRPALSGDGLANAAKGLSFIADAKLPVTDGTAVVAEAVRQGFRSHEVLDLGREIKRRERDFIAGRRRYARCATRSRAAIDPSSCSAVAPSRSSGPRRHGPRRRSGRNGPHALNDPSGQRRRGRKEGSGRLRGRNNSRLKVQNSNRDCGCSHCLSFAF